MSLLYYAPWVGEASRVKLGPYIVSFFWFFWFLFVWLLMVFYFYRAYSLRKTKRAEGSFFLRSGFVILASYVIVFVGIFNGYMVSV